MTTAPANRLINEKSPYLQQHAHNPVDWYPWGHEAFELAKTTNRPIFLSIGYSTCHWCHVMEHESFEDPAIAKIMNSFFVNIKVDREERPDIDSIYMTAVQLLTGSGGWPMSVWLTSDLKPFYGGTYFPPDDRYGRPGFANVLTQIAAMWEKEKEKLVHSSDEITKAIGETASRSGAKTSALSSFESIAEKAFNQLQRTYDPDDGGFGQAPKFPMPTYLHFLLATHSRTKNQDALNMVAHTFRKMIKGGIYDQLGGGFSRYSTDARWIVPHFEKMLYDNSQLLDALSFLMQKAPDPLFEQALRQSADYILRDMTHPNGGFYSAEDADSEGKEGTFYLWTMNEIKKILSPDLADLFIQRHGITVNGNFFDPHTRETGKNILTQAQELSTADHEKLKTAENLLIEIRNKRPRPHLDDKIISEWNGLMISALAHVADVLREQKYLDAAVRAANFLEMNLFDSKEKALYRRWRDGERKIDGHQSDYAFVVQGLLDLFEATTDTHWLEWAISLHEQHNALFWDEKDGGYFMTTEKADLLLRVKDDGDNVIPSGNSCAARNGFQLGALLGRTDFSEKAQQTLNTFAKILNETPAALTSMLLAFELATKGHGQIVVVGPKNRADTRALMDIASLHRTHTTMVLSVDPDAPENKLATIAPFIGSLRMLNQKATAFVCVNAACKHPTIDPKELLNQLEDK